MTEPIRMSRTVEFVETDAAGLLHFSNCLRYVEAAERQLFARLGLPLISESDNLLFGFPRTRVHCDYRAPASFGEDLEVLLWLKRVDQRSLHFHFRIEKPDSSSPVVVAEGEMVTVFAVRDRTSGRLESREMPESYLTALKDCCG